MTLIIEEIKPSVYVSFKSIREHIAHKEISFNSNIFETVQASTLTSGSLLELKEKVLNSGKVSANGTDLDFLLKEQKMPAVAEMLEMWRKCENEYGNKYLFIGTIYNSLTYQCSGDIRCFWYYEKYNQWVETPECLDGRNVLSNDFVVFLK